MKIKIAIIVLILLLLGGGAFLCFNENKTQKDAIITIEEGTSSRAIARQLKEEGVISSEINFLVQLKMSKFQGKLQYGTYTLEKGMSFDRLFYILATQGAKENTVNITIPEGYTAEMIGAKIEKLGLFTKEEFLEAVNTKEEYDFSWMDQIEEEKGRQYLLQGYLYPDTYNVYLSATPKDVVTMMLQNFETHYKQIQTKEDMDELVIKASIIERETSVASERPIIAGVIENRLSKNMRLQIDPTALYPLTKGMYDQTKVTYEDLKIDSLYNTYRYAGLPIGPICNPSIDCIKAAANPEKHEYLYYHTKTKTSAEHVFFKTYEEHLESQKH